MSDSDIRIHKACSRYVSLSGGSYEQLSKPSDKTMVIKIYNENKKLFSYGLVVDVPVLIKQQNKNLSLNVKNLLSVSDKRLNPMIIFSCDDGILYLNAMSVIGQCRFVESIPGVSYSSELTICITDFKPMKYIRY